MTDNEGFDDLMNIDGAILGKILSQVGLEDMSYKSLDIDFLYDSLTEEELAHVLSPLSDTSIISVREDLLQVSLERCLLWSRIEE